MPKSKPTTSPTTGTSAPLRNSATTPYQRTVTSHRKAQGDATQGATPAPLEPDLQRIAEALQLALWHLQHSEIQAATGWASSAARRLQNLCGGFDHA